MRLLKKVELLNISKTYDRKQDVISNISVTIEPGEFFVLVGPSGCGKSTILRMIAGLEDITDGVIKIGEKEINLLPPSKRDLSMVFQNYALYPHLSVEENIIFGLHVKKVSKSERKKRCSEVADMLGLGSYLQRKPRELSGGQRQRVALARAIVNQSPICLMDEPLSNLDAKLRAHMRSEIRQIQRRLGITMIYVTHDQVEAMTMGDRMMILHNGEIQQIGKPIEIYNRPANPFVATFIGSPPMNLVSCTNDWKTGVINIDNTLKFFIKPEDQPAVRNRQLTVGIRPEHILHSTNGLTNTIKMQVQVINVEVLGTETIIAFHLGGKVWLAKWNGQWRISVNDIIPIEIDYDSICLFDEKSGGLVKSPAKIERHIIVQEVMI